MYGQITAEPVARLIDEFSKLPGIGPKTAQRLTYFLLRAPSEQAHALAEALELSGHGPYRGLRFAGSSIEGFDLWADAGEIAASDFLSDAELGQLGAEFFDLGAEVGHGALTCATASEDRHRRERAAGSGHSI